jgi:hypothetical protein
LNVFGIEADFMEKFREFLKEEGLPGNERRKIITIPLNVTYDFGKKLKILRPKRKASDGKEYDFKKDAPVPTVGDIPDYMTNNTVVADWYPRIQAMQSRGNIPGDPEGQGVVARTTSGSCWITTRSFSSWSSSSASELVQLQHHQRRHPSTAGKPDLVHAYLPEAA